ncbi:MAG: flagellar brake protein [Gammaproteobacteria bacterium]|nr:flagellar brake protein [Gammaproteobacteria bacterium]MDH5777986.1 flagellar brake protein [Gammaproteobacteria bacterium]
MDHLDINIGSPLNLQLLSGEGKQRYDVHLIGMLPGKSLLITMPRVNGALPKIFAHDEYIVRYFAGKDITAFRTSVLLVCQIPYHYIHLNYPKEVENVTVRQAERIDITITAQVNYQGNKSLATIKDISASGAMLVAAENFGQAGDPIELFFDLQLGEIKKNVHLVALIRNIKKNEGEEKSRLPLRYGVEFVDPSEQDAIFVQGFVYEQLLRKRE